MIAHREKQTKIIRETKTCDSKVKKKMAVLNVKNM